MECQKFYGQIYYSKLKHEKGLEEANKYLQAYNSRESVGEASQLTSNDMENEEYEELDPM